MRTAVILTGWAFTTVAGFWWYDGRYRLPVQLRSAAKPTASVAWAFPGAKATLLSFYTPGCGCSRFAEPHVAELQRRYGAKGLRIVTIVEGEGSAPKFDRQVYDSDGTIARTLGIAAAPGAVVLNEKGELIYIGGFNVARFCDDRRTAYAEQAIAATLQGRSVVRTRGAFYGCATVAAG